MYKKWPTDRSSWYFNLRINGGIMQRSYKMHPFDAYIMYIALKRHFTQKTYDYHKYNGKIKASYTAFKKRNDKSFFEKIASKYNKQDLENLYVSNFIVDHSLWVGDIANESGAVTVYKQWMLRQEALTYQYSEELKLIRQFIIDNDCKFNDIVVSPNPGNHPVLFKLLLQDVISMETFCILDNVVNFSRYFERDMIDDEIWGQKGLVVRKYKPFLKYDIDAFKENTRTIMTR